MDIVIPIEFSDSYILSTNITDIEYQAWDESYVDPSTSTSGYVVGDLVDQDYKVYKSVIDENTDDPTGESEGVNADVPTWVFMGWSNARRMYTEGVDTQTSNSSIISMSLSYPTLVETFALLNVEGSDGTIVVKDSSGNTLEQRDFIITDIGVDSWWEYDFLDYTTKVDHVFQDLPSYIGAQIEVTVNSSGDAKVGRVVAGVSHKIGETDYGTSTGKKRYRDITRDGFGNVVITPRRNTKKATFEVTVYNEDLDKISKLFDIVENVATLFIGTKGVEGMTSSTNIFGVFTDFDNVIEYYETSSCSIEVEGY